MPAMVATLEGVRELRRELRAVDASWGRELRKVFKAIAKKAEDLAQTEARSMGGIQAKAAAAIKGQATQESAALVVSGGRRLPFANVAFWGVDPEHRLGWYSAERYSDSGPQHLPEWVGNTWDVAVAGQGPYAINAALARYAPDIPDEFGDMVEDLLSRAFPGR